jgi:uncharacterized protein (TIGR03067 family)
VLKTRAQGYHLGTDPDGHMLAAPDFKRPFGSPFEVEYRSAPSNDKAILKDSKAVFAEIDGTWKLTKYIENGKANEEEVRANYRIIRKEGTQEITKDDKPFSKRQFMLNPELTPKHIDFIDADGGRTRGIYELNGTEMRVALFADPEKRKGHRPTDFKEEGKIIAVYERSKGTD